MMRRAGAWLLLGALAACGAAAPSNLRDGDIVFQTSLSSQSVAIQRATKSPYSHMGVVFYRNGQPYVLEAVATVRYTPLGAWLGRGKGGHFVAKRLKTAEGVPAGELEKLRREGHLMLGRPYDSAFGWSDERIYCSELVWKLYDRALGIRLAPLQELGSFDLSSLEVKAKLRERYGSSIPVHEPVVPPSAIFDSALLETVASR
jgi:hypothetical protein